MAKICPTWLKHPFVKVSKIAKAMGVTRGCLYHKMNPDAPEYFSEQDLLLLDKIKEDFINEIS